MLQLTYTSVDNHQMFDVMLTYISMVAWFCPLARSRSFNPPFLVQHTIVLMLVTNAMSVSLLIVTDCGLDYHCGFCGQLCVQHVTRAMYVHRRTMGNDSTFALRSVGRRN